MEQAEQAEQAQLGQFSAPELQTLSMVFLFCEAFRMRLFQISHHKCSSFKLDFPQLPPNPVFWDNHVLEKVKRCKKLFLEVLQEFDQGTSFRYLSKAVLLSSEEMTRFGRPLLLLQLQTERTARLT